MVKKRRNPQEIETTIQPLEIEATDREKKLRTSLEEIRNYDGVIGYILRNTTSASIDLKDPTKLVDYAILSSTAFDAADEISELFALGNIRCIGIQGKDLRMLSLAVEDNKMSIFMENSADADKILERIQML